MITYLTRKEADKMNKAEAMDEIIRLLKQAEREHHSGQFKRSNQTITKLIGVISEQYEQHKERERIK